MNDKALYQLERAVDALKLMAEALREEHTPVSFTTGTTGDVVFPTAWNDDTITIDKSTLYDLVQATGNIDIKSGNDGVITFS